MPRDHCVPTVLGSGAGEHCQHPPVQPCPLLFQSLQSLQEIKPLQVGCVMELGGLRSRVPRGR